jgi:outer membrane protein assembly factor BamB
VVNGKVYFGAGDDGLYCVDAATGKQVWHFEGLHVDASPAVVDDRLYCGSGVGDVFKDTAVFCLDVETGRELWRVPTPLPAWGSPAVDGNQVFFGLGNGNFVESADKPAGSLWCLDAGKGRRLWTDEVPDGVLVKPAVDHKRVYFGSRDGHCYAVERKSGRPVWKEDLGSPVVSSPALVGCSCCGAGASLYVVGSDGRVCCLDPESGQVYWTFEVTKDAQRKAQVFASPAVVTSRIAGGQRREIYVGTGLISATSSNAAVLYCLADQIEER